MKTKLDVLVEHAEIPSFPAIYSNNLPVKSKSGSEPALVAHNHLLRGTGKELLQPRERFA
jgi:hypothetical protein